MVNKEDSKSDFAIGNQKKDYSQDDNGCAWQKSIRDYVDGTYKDASTVDASITGSRAGYFITNVDQPLRLSSCRGKILFLTRNYYGTSQSATTPVYGGVIRDWKDNTILMPQFIRITQLKFAAYTSKTTINRVTCQKNKIT